VEDSGVILIYFTGVSGAYYMQKLRQTQQNWGLEKINLCATVMDSKNNGKI
jgi:hypothetical protein